MTSHILTGGEAPLFQKRMVAELSDIEMVNIDGGTTAVCAATPGFGIGMTAVVTAVGLAVAGYNFGYWVGAWAGGFFNPDNQMVE